MNDLFTYIPPLYPHTAGFKEACTSADAAATIETSGGAEILRHRALKAIGESIFGMTADEIAQCLAVTVLACRPRISELRARGLIKDTGIRRKNISGVNAKVWAVV